MKTAPEILAEMTGFDIEYTDTSGKPNKLSEKEIRSILKIHGINIENDESLEDVLLKLELEKVRSVLPKVQVIKISEKPSIKINIPEENINNTYEWILEKENGSHDSGKFIASSLKKTDSRDFGEFGSYIELNLKLPLSIEPGYHTLKINDYSGNLYETKFITVPYKCYEADAVLRNEKIFGPKINFHNIKNQNNQKIPDSNDLKDLIRKINVFGVGIIGIGPINQTAVDENRLYNPYLPSHRMFFSTFMLNPEEIEKFIDDKELKLKFLSSEFQEKAEELEDAEEIDYKAVCNFKYEKFKLLYRSFKEFHINNNTDKAAQFYDYVNKKGDYLKKSALFRALQDFLSAKDLKYTGRLSWPVSYQSPDSEAVLQFENTNSELIELYMFLQWQADLQFASAGKISYEKKLDIGIYVDLPLCANLDGAEVWINQQYFCEDAILKIPQENKQEFIKCPAVLPRAMYNNAYAYFKDVISPNMVHAGAVNILYMKNFFNSERTVIIDNTEKDIRLNWPVRDLLGIIALESQRNQCMVIVDMNDISEENKNLLLNNGIYNEERFGLTEIFDETGLNNYSESLKNGDNIDYEDLCHITKIPDSSYRIQFNKEFTFNQATEIIPYLKKLGISHVYASPLLLPKSGSMHGYDTVNHNSINLEAGTFEEFNRFVDTLHYHGTGLILDTVPNHMSTNKENKWWQDVLENGQASEYAHYFDIEWNPIKPELKGKVLVPVLGDRYGNILSGGLFNFNFNEEAGKFYLNYYEHEFPLDPSSYPAILEYRLDVLVARLGTSTKDFPEYLSILTVFKNLPKNTETEYEKIRERIREKDIAHARLSELCRQNYVVKGFLEENLIDFKCSPDNRISMEKVHNLLEEQAYRLAYWRVSADEINYRRFFDVNDLIAVCVEKPDVFTNTHNFILDLVENKRIDGIRLDHPDGLLDPTEYYKKLQSEISKRLDLSFDADEPSLLCSEKLPFYIVAEKILAPFEKLPSNQAIHGTVGYEFLNSLNGLFIKKENEKKFNDIYKKFIDREINLDETVIECKKLIMRTSLTGELNVLSFYLNQISELYYYSRDYTLNSIRNALIEVISCFPVYRTYVSAAEESTKCADYTKWATRLAKKRSLVTDTSIFEFIEQVLLLELEPDKESYNYKKILKFVMKFQQYTGPLMAKGFEDTCFYRYNRLVSLNEVGGEPGNFGVSVNEFHRDNLNRRLMTPDGMLSTSTHDTKRSEDLRVRISVISEIPDEWQKAVKRWSSLTKRKKKDTRTFFEIDKNDEYLFWQTLIGIWSSEYLSYEKRQNLIDRLENYILKAVKEAKVHTSWVNINSEYEQCICDFIRKVLNYPKKHPFWKEFIPFQKKVAACGYLNSISQCVLKFTSPGVPDIYQGNEVFNFRLVDPDNRQPVDYSKNIELFEKIEPLLKFNPENYNSDYSIFNELLLPRESGALKLFYTAATLNFRQIHSDLFRAGEYIPLQTIGKHSEHITAFARLTESSAIITAVPRLVYKLISDTETLKIIPEIFDDTKILLPENFKDFNFTNIYTKQNINTSDNKISVNEALNILPAAVLFGEKVAAPVCRKK